MRCPNCAFENASDARFCENCGQPLEATCPNCGQPVSPNAKFCKNCGFNLASAAAVARPAAVARSATLDALRRAAPAEMAHRILEEKDRLEGERKLVTALFTDIVGSTSLAEEMDPEDWREVVSGAHAIVSQAVYRYDGTIAQLLGDGVLAFFGAPFAHEDDAERGIRAALEILGAVKDYAADLRRRGRVSDFRMRAGLNSGLVVVGNIGSDLHMEYLAVGDTVNLAARLQSAAEPDTILISDKTRRLAGDVFVYEDRGKIEIKGKAEPVHAYRVVDERRGAVRGRGLPGLSSPLVGRQREFSTLLQVAHDLLAGRGAAVSIIGEAGLGKSRLVAEWRKAVQHELEGKPLRWIEGRCLSYGASMAHHLSTDVLRASLEVSPDASEAELQKGLDRTLHRLFGDDASEVYPYLGHLLGLDLDSESAERVKYLDGPALQAKYIAAYKEFLRAAAGEAPTVIVCEDVHWADPSSVELGIHILPIVAEAPVAVVLVTRSDKDAPGWKLVAQAHEIAGVGAIDLHLAPLSETDSQELVRNLLEIEALPDSVRSLILAKAEGNPFFVEEVIRMLIDRGALAQDDGKWVVRQDIREIEIPDTLQGVLTARIDRLPEEAKRILQVASVIGRKFQVRVLEKVLEKQGWSPSR